MWFPNRPDTKWHAQSQKQARCLKFRFKKKKRKCTIRVAKTKALISFAVSPRSNREADLRLCFRIGWLILQAKNENLRIKTKHFLHACRL